MNGVYFSGSGNTRHCAEFFAQLTGGRAVSMEAADALGLVKESDELFVAYPIHYSNLPKIVRDFLTQNAGAFAGKKVFIIATMGLFSGDGAGLAARILKKAGAKILGGLHLRMPDSIADVKMLKKPFDQNLALVKAADQKIAGAACQIKVGRYPKDGLNFFALLAGLFGQRLWFIPTVNAARSKLKVNQEKCAGCGLCVKNCPTASLSVQDGKAAFVPGKCTLCYRCVNSCPANAISLLGKEVFERCNFEKYLEA